MRKRESSGPIRMAGKITACDLLGLRKNLGAEGLIGTF